MSAHDARLADSLDALTSTIGCLITELRMQRAQVSRLSAALGIEIEDREESDRAHGLRLVEHEREINRLKIPAKEARSQDAE